LKIDDERYYLVASAHTFSILSYGQHKIYLRAVDQDDNKDPTPAKFTFAIQKASMYPNDYDNDDRIDHKDLYNKIEDSENDVEDTILKSENRIKKKVEDSEHDIKRKVEDSEDDVIYAREKKLNVLEDTITEEHAVQDEELEDIQKAINKLRQGQQNLSDEVDQKLDIIIIHSTMPVGETRKLKEKYRLRHLYINPLFFRDRAVETHITSQHRILLGVAPEQDIDPVALLFINSWANEAYGAVQTYILPYEHAELVKLCTNALRGTVITFFNEVNEYLQEYERGQPGNRDAIIGTLLNPKNVISTWEGGQWGTDTSKLGEPYGGKCIPKDVDHLAKGFPVRNAINIFEVVDIINQARKVLKFQPKSNSSSDNPSVSGDS
jgi:UDPglucose 6-dehydrogenase